MAVRRRSRAYLRRATFKAWLAAADDPELAELPPPSLWPVPAGALAALPAGRSLR